MKIITTTIEDFIKAEIAEHGHDYVEAQFLMGFEPTIVNGIWVWFKSGATSVPIHNKTSTIDRHRSSSSLRSGGDHMALIR